jgi:pimeloyl-ACP methyl ester carboxylesterase
MCGHGLGYAQSFQFSAARRGRLIAPQGDLRCGQGDWAKWSANVEALEERIQASFANLNTEPGPALVMGYSQGATRAEQLARSHPERYAWLIAIGAPSAPSPQGLRHLQRAVMMAGERDRQDLMRSAASAFDRAGIPTIFLELPEASHGAMGREPERTMSQAFAWLFDESAARTAAKSAR